MLEVKNMTKIYRPADGMPVTALAGVDIQFEDTGMVFILGKSGSGKSTLLNLMGGLDSMDNGEIIIKGKSSKDFKKSDFDSYRNTFVGFIFQEYNILDEFTVGKNISLALELQGKKYNAAAVEEILKQVDLEGYASRKPSELSGGQKQRVAIARALIKNPEIIMADEPTGALDSNTGKQVFETLKKLSETKLVIVVSHDREYAEYYGDRVIEFADGKIISDIKKCKMRSAMPNDGMILIDDNILHIQQGHKLSDEDKDALIQFVENSSQDIIVSKDEKTNFDVRKMAHIDVEGNQESFAVTSTENLKLTEHDPTGLKLVKSRLPYKRSFKIGASSLKAKPIRLFFTIILSAVALGLFGLADTFGSFNQAKAAYASMQDRGIEFVNFTKKETTDDNVFDFWEGEINLTQADTNMLQEKFPDHDFRHVYSWSANYEANALSMGSFYYPHLNSFVEASSNWVQKIGFELIGTYPASIHEVAITDYAFQNFKDNGYINELDQIEPINQPSDLFGKKLKIFDQMKQTYSEHTITGIVKTGYNAAEFESLKEQIDNVPYAKLQNLFEYGFLSCAFVADGFYDLVYGQELSYPAAAISKGSTANYTHLDAIRKYDPTLYTDGYIIGNKTELANDEIIISSSLLELFYRDILTGTSFTTRYDGTNYYELVGELIFHSPLANKEVTIISPELGEGSDTQYYRIVGVFEDDSPYRFIECNESVAKQWKAAFPGIKSFVTPMLGSKAKDYDLLKFSYQKENNIRFAVANEVTAELENLNTILAMLAKLFLYIGIFFAVFAALLMMNFIATSISYKKREIGILRAVGARSSDVFGIFFNESLIISVINFVTAFILTVVTASILNGVFKKDLGLIVTLLIVGARQFALMLGVSLGTAFLASAIPIFRIAKKKPIEAIKQ